MAKKTSSPQKAQVGSKKTNLLSILDGNHKWVDKDEVLDAVYWFRQIAAIFIGLIWGFLGFTGSTAIVSFAVINSAFAHMIAKKTGYDFEPDESFLSIKEGFMTTFATFLVTWIVTYTSFHH